MTYFLINYESMVSKQFIIWLEGWLGHISVDFTLGTVGNNNKKSHNQIVSHKLLLWADRWRFHTYLKLWSFPESLCLLKFVLKGKSMSKILSITLLLSPIRHIYQLHEQTNFYTLSTFPALLVLQSKYFRGQRAGFRLFWTSSGTFP